MAVGTIRQSRRVFMAAFSKKAFDAANYLSHRPVYPATLLNKIVNNHKDNGGALNTLLDIGCGPGQIAHELSKQFTKVIAIDPSSNMISMAREHLSGVKCETEFHQGSVEDMPYLSSNSVDLAIAGQAAHWFDFSLAWKELHRILKPGGTVAFIAYSDPFIVGERGPSEDIYHFSHDKLGPYWQQPGRRLVENLLTEIPFPTGSEWNGGLRLGFDGHPFIHYDSHQFTIPNGDDLPLMHKKGGKKMIEDYLTTWSSVNTYREKHPQEKDTFLPDFFRGFWARREKETGHRDDIIIAWPSSITLLHKSH
ncbi:hypothetical protein PROFUN_13440 [Planoprotostelium fungivorum]|uniref:Methyltransferase type 11 domain-containing protein n=1 Tax=Planoprotostelium fungivorum TaxID=1890364 RepID=A0A2P6N439_9EUKA|nr:hypothetical protein PROFUN_13440 [Planoprotostelium fungivorum]